MSRVAFSLLIGMLGIAIAGCATQSQSNYLIPREKFVAKVHRIAIFPVLLPTPASVGASLSPEESQAIRAAFERIIAEQLQSLGYSVIPPSEVRLLMEPLLKNFGAAIDLSSGAVMGLIDRTEGRRDDSKRDALIQQLRTELRNKSAVDAVLFSGIGWRVAATYSYWAQWDGTWQAWEQGALTPDRPGAAYLSRDVVLPGLIAPPKNDLVLPAVSILGAIIDTAGDKTTSIWEGSGGIHLLRMSSGKGSLSDLSYRDALGKENRNREAVQVMLESLKRR